MNAYAMDWSEDDSVLMEDGSLYLGFDRDEKSLVLLSEVSYRYCTHQLSGRSLKFSYKCPMLKRHIGIVAESNFKTDKYQLLNDESVIEINEWLKQEAIMKLEEEHYY